MTGDPLTQLGLNLNLKDDELVSDAILIMKVHRTDGTVYVAQRVTEGTDWVTVRGLLDIAIDIESGSVEDVALDDDPDL